jgi:hypothetical protein
MKRLATPLLLAGALLLTVASASAQTTFRLGVRGGANRALTTVATASNSPNTYPFSYSADKSAIYAWQAGLVAEWAWGKFALQPGLQFSQKGEKLNTSATTDGIVRTSSQTTSINRYNWLELPLNFVYTLHSDHGLQLFAGPYYGPAVDGIPFDFDNPVSYGTDTNNHRFDAGANFGIGYRQGPVQVQLGYGLGLLNLHQPSTNVMLGAIYHEFNADAAYNRVAQLTGTYFFSL